MFWTGPFSILGAFLENVILRRAVAGQYSWPERPLSQRLYRSRKKNERKIVLGAQKNCLNETVLLSTHNKCFV